ncbi:MAG: AAA family ATPase [Nevskiales bacterium]
MRLQRLDLLAYGKFTAQAIEFPSGVPDFHFVLGPNEAGKSTMRDALADLLFGISGQSPYGFLHAYQTMRLAAVIEEGGKRCEFHRTKRNRQPLRDAADNPLPDDLLTPFLGGADRSFYERMFGLDHRRLDEGGSDILQAKDDVGRMLFESAAGLASFGPFRAELEKEADELFSKRHSATRAFYRLNDRLEATERALHDASLRPSDWKERQTTLQTAQETLTGSTTEVEQLDLKRTRLERVRRVSSDLRALNSARQERESLKEAPLLPTDSAQVFDQAEKVITLAEHERQRLEAETVTITERLSTTSVDDVTLAFKDEIGELTEFRGFIHKHESDISKLQNIVAARRQTLEDDARQLGWSADDLETLQSKLPSSAFRAELRALIERQGSLVTTVDLCKKALTVQEREIEDDKVALAAAPEVTIPTELRAALKSAAVSSGNADELIRLDAQISQAARRLSQANAALNPWYGDIQTLRALPVLDIAAVRDVRDRALAIEQKREAHKTSLQELRDELSDHRNTAAKIEKEQHPVTSEALQGVRDERDGLWTRIRDGEITPKGAASKYEHAVVHADEFADRRYADASAVTTLESANAGTQRTEKKIQSRETELQRLDASAKELESEWTGAMATLGLQGMKSQVYSGWLERREAALQAVEQKAEAESQQATLTSHAEQARMRLLRAANLAGLETKDIAQLSLVELVEWAEKAIKEADTTNTHRLQLVEALRKARAAQPRLRDDLTAATNALKQWELSWQRTLTSAGLDPALSVTTASTALDMIHRIDTTLREIRQIEVDRIGAMRTDLDSFENQAREIAKKLEPQLATAEPLEISRRLEERLHGAELVQRDHDKDQQALEKANQELTAANAKHLKAEAGLAPLFKQSATKTIADLREAIRRSERCRQLDAQIASLDQILAEKGDGLALEQLEQEVAGEDLITIPGRLETLVVQRSAAVERRDGCIRAVSSTQQLLDACAGQQQAANAEAQRQEALAELTQVVERYVKIKTAERLLRWGLERYRQDKQGPLLEAAGHYFGALTCGSFAGLLVDFDHEPPALLGKRPSGKLIAVDGMSAGTRDSLYLALRLAAVELHLRAGKALPFIADDLFVNIDDERAAAGFAALATLATKTQVVYLSHHQHLIPVAQQAFRAQMNQVQLSR